MTTKEPGITKVTGIKGVHYRVQIRLKGCRPLSKNFDCFQEARDWKRQTIAAVKSGQPYETTEMRRQTVGDLIDRFLDHDILALRNHRTIRGHLEWWRRRRLPMTICPNR